MYMSTSLAAKIAALRDARKLREYEPKSRHKPKRRIYLTDKAFKEISDSALQWFGAKAQILGALDTWVLGRLITGTRSRGDFLVPLDPPPPDVWEIKVRAPTVEGRLFVRFLEPDALLMTHCHTRRSLDAGFQAAMDECVASWNELFPEHEPFRGNSIHDYVTSNCDDFPHIARKPNRR